MTSGGRPQRQRVVLAHRRGTRIVHTRVEVQEQTEVGDARVRGLVRAQLGLALRLGGLVFGALAALAVITHVRGLADATVAGLPLNWLFLGLLVYPVVYVVGRVFVRLAEQGERDFLGVVDPAGDR